MQIQHILCYRRLESHVKIYHFPPDMSIVYKLQENTYKISDNLLINLFIIIANMICHIAGPAYIDRPNDKSHV